MPNFIKKIDVSQEFCKKNTYSFNLFQIKSQPCYTTTLLKKFVNGSSKCQITLLIDVN